MATLRSVETMAAAAAISLSCPRPSEPPTRAEARCFVPLAKGFDKAVTRANKVAIESFDSTADQLADDLLRAAKKYAYRTECSTLGLGSR